MLASQVLGSGCCRALQQAAAVINLSSLDGTTGFRLDGELGGDASGGAVSAAGYVNGNSINDLIIGASLADFKGGRSGSSHVVFGLSAGGFAAAINLSALDGSDGFRLDGVESEDRSGGEVSTVDLNNDGINDLLIGADSAMGGTSAAASYLVYGRSEGFASPIQLASLDDSTGMVLHGAEWFNFSGRELGSAGDVNGDGAEHLIIGAFGADPNTTESGSAFLVFGTSTHVFADDLEG